ncbi:amino acid permease [Streptomyces sp. NPDC002896]|uniref:amino acid permease n=1 Tax=Streptomyces sp. NPDC002896 TaxID=3154438 RepID=UPI00332B97D1
MPDKSAIGGVFVITFVSYVGFEQTAIYSEEARDRRRTVPRATYTAVLFLAVAYTFCAWVTLMAAGPFPARKPPRRQSIDPGVCSQQ